MLSLSQRRLRILKVARPGLLRIEFVSEKSDDYFYAMEWGDSQSPNSQREPEKYRPHDLAGERARLPNRRLPFHDCIHRGYAGWSIFVFAASVFDCLKITAAYAAPGFYRQNKILSLADVAIRCADFVPFCLARVNFRCVFPSPSHRGRRFTNPRPKDSDAFNHLYELGEIHGFDHIGIDTVSIEFDYILHFP